MNTSGKNQEPSQEVLKAFNLEGDIKLLSGGQGGTFLVDGIILKFYPFTKEEELNWLAELLNKLSPRKFRVQRFIKANNGKYIFNDWGAYAFLKGESRDDLNHLKLKKEALQEFHKEIRNEPEPRFISERTHHWAIADKMAWGEKPIKCNKILMGEITKILPFIEPLNLASQLIQGDPHNILFSDKEPPAMIDLSMYFRPVDFSLAVLAVDELCCWCKDECKCLNPNDVYEMFEEIPLFNQLLLRAVLRRTLESEGFWKTDGRYLKFIEGIKPAIEFACSLF